jgi:O-antigen/teichoic acid export membrane protein
MKNLSRLTDRLPLFVRKLFVSVVLRFGSLGLQFAGSILVARQLGAAGFGAYGYAFTWAVLIGTLLGLGMGQLSIREVPRYLAHGNFAALRGFVTSWLLGLIVSGLLASGVIALCQAEGWLEFSIPWPLVMLAALAHALVLGLSALLSGFQRILQSQFLESILRQVLFLSALLLCVWLGLQLDTQNIFEITLLAVLPVILLMAVILRKSMRQAMAGQRPAMQMTTLVWLSASLPLLLTTLTTQLQTGLDTLVLGAMVDDKSLGLFRAASRGTDLVLIANGLALQVLGPMLARALAKGERAEAQSLISQSAVMSAGLGLSICAVLALFPGFYLGLFGAEFRAATPVLWVLVATQAVALLCGPSALVLVMLHREKLVLLTTVTVLALNFGLKLLFIPLWGMIGSAYATLISVILLRVFLTVCVIRVGGFDPTLWTPLKRRLTRDQG